MLLIVSALEEELHAFVGNLQHSEEIPDFPFPVYRGILLDTIRVVLAAVGSGKVQAGLYTSLLISRFSPHMMYGIGICAGIDPDLHVGDMVVVQSAVQYDLDLQQFGYSRGDINGPLPRYIQAENWADAYPGIRRVVAGTADRFMTSSYVREHPWLRDDLHIHIADMESYVWMAAASVWNTPCGIFRVVSDTVSGERPKSFRKFMHRASKRLLDGVLERERQLDCPQ